MFLLNSRTSLFVATCKSSGSKSLHHRRHPLSLSYGVNLPSSLTTLLPLALGFSPHLPVSVSVRTPCFQRLEAFLVSVVTANSPNLRSAALRLPGLRTADLPAVHPSAFDRDVQHPARLTYCVPPSLQQGGTGILTCPPSTTPLGLALGSD